ncbi:DUF4198 domain-containing protein [Echinimonas agarilytica]|uniref:DUF4198 domain-containing protein n=1 Tax=Echinimonas agarilytica TaxID=1215918 RepID=A0AA41W5U5_9GAMM|nr:DUF4198 domain-containing protein [Echinimonas agarilytica]MCM2679410.1 DUF4198 domain-containing protein [Echinimonas agarilytica]
MHSIKYMMRAAAGLLCSAALVSTVTAHERFVVPTHTLLSGDAPQSVNVVGSISNDIFHPDKPLGDTSNGDHVPRLKALFEMLDYWVVQPDGRVTDTTRWEAFSRLSVADVELLKSGTHRVSLSQPETRMTTFVKADGTPSRVFGDKPEIPEGATDIVRRESQSRVETFVTLNEPTTGAVKPMGIGIEIGGEQHPNDLFVGETATFQLFFEGKPLVGEAKATLIKGGTRHRNDRNEQVLVVGKDGSFSFTATEAGFYFLNLTTQIDVTQPADVDVKHATLYLTLEVFPQ